jgi:hypothetical protein
MLFVDIGPIHLPAAGVFCISVRDNNVMSRVDARADGRPPYGHWSKAATSGASARAAVVCDGTGDV